MAQLFESRASLPAPAEERRRRLREWIVRSVMLLPALLLLAFFFFSIARMIAMTLVDDNGLTLALYREFIARPDYLGIYVRTIVVSLAVTALSIVVGYPIAYGIWRYPGNRNILMILVILPWLVSIVVRTYGWIVILGPRGLVNELLKWAGVIESPIRLMFNTTGVVIGLVHVLMPFMIISVLTVLLHLDKSLDEASKSLGARPWYGFCRVTLPLSLPGIVSGAILVFLMSTGAIVTPILLGGVQDRMVGTQIYQEAIQTFNFPKASMLAFLLLLSGLALALPLQWIERRLTAWSRSRRTAS